MGIESFPEIESFHKLPRQVIVKGASSTYDQEKGALLHGIVINNIGHAISQIRVNVVIFDTNKMPVLNTSTVPQPDTLPQGKIGAFSFQFKEYPEEITDYHLFTSWKFVDKE
ncbi:MAG: hypothetical protein WC352_03145 [Candidatus Omnitrophota bacterium]|jgi:hypothetical protein